MRPARLLWATAALSAGLSGAVSAQDNCSADIDSNDAMQFDTDVMVVDSSCDEFSVNLTHSGELDRDVMGHNWVLSEADDVEGIAEDGIAAGLENNYLPPEDDRVIAYTEVIGGGEETSVTFDVNQLDPDTVYTFFCSFPGHSSVMRGTLSVE